MKLIAQYNNDLNLLESEIDIFLLAYQGLSSHYQHETTKTADLIKQLHLHHKQAFGYINRFIFEPEIDWVKSKLKELISLDIDGFVVNDFGLMTILRQFGFEKPIYLQTDTTITNSLEIDTLVNQGFTKIFTARELTFVEIHLLAQKEAQKMVVPIFGHQIISTSRRQLLSAYGDLIEKKFKSNHFYKLRESTRSDYFILQQDETGTHIFDEKVFVGFEGFQPLLDLGVEDFLMDTINLDTKTIILVASILRQLANRELDTDQALALLPESFSTTSALWHLKTTDKKE